MTLGRLVASVTIVLLLSFKAAIAQVTTVEIIHFGTDMLGQQLAFQLKEAVRGSQSFRLSVQPALGLRVFLTTMDPESQTPRFQNLQTIYSAAFTWNDPDHPYDFFLNHYVGICGASKLRHCADFLLAKASDAADQITRKPPPPAGRR